MSNLSMLGLYDNPDSAADALDALHEAGFDSNNFDVLTGTPYPEGAFGEHVPQHRLFRFPLFGAIVGLTLSVFLTTSTQIIYPLVTGGKPILSIFAMLVIMYEMTMLSAVVTTVIGILFESRFEIPKDCWVEDLYELTYQKSINLFLKSLPNLINMNFDLIPQESLYCKRGSSLHYINEINDLKKN